MLQLLLHLGADLGNQSHLDGGRAAEKDDPLDESLGMFHLLDGAAWGCGADGNRLVAGASTRHCTKPSKSRMASMLGYVEIVRHHQLQSHFVRRVGQTEAHSGFDIRPLGGVIEDSPYLMRLLI